jgi:hypothetical protein
MKELNQCLEDCIKWNDNEILKLNDSQQVEYFRLVSFVMSTKYQYEQILKIQTGGFLSQKFDELKNRFSTINNLFILQVERDLFSSNVNISTIYKLIKNEKSIEEMEELNSSQHKGKLDELRLKSHLYKFKIKNCILEQITNYKNEQIPISVYNFID